MKLYTNINDELKELNEVTICIETEEELASLKDFFVKKLKEMNNNSKFEHTHYKDFIQNEMLSDIILFRKENRH